MAFCDCREAALCETSETQGVTLEGSVCFDFLKTEDRGANESLEEQKSGGLPCKEAAPEADGLPLSAQPLYQLPHKLSDSSWSRSLHRVFAFRY